MWVRVGVRAVRLVCRCAERTSCPGRVAPEWFERMKGGALALGGRELRMTDASLTPCSFPYPELKMLVW